MIHLLYTADHANRATALAAANPGSRHGLIDTTKPAAIQGLDTLSFWGHGDQWKLCNKTPDELVRLIGQWKALNATLKTVELITCNARHCVGGDAYANRVKNGLHGFLSSTRDITVKALPTTVSGKLNAFSILLAETNTKSWVYVTAPGADDKLLMQAQSLIQYERTQDGRLVSFRGDIAQRADKTVRDNPQRQWTMNYGYFNTLRSCLGKV